MIKIEPEKFIEQLLRQYNSTQRKYFHVVFHNKYTDDTAPVEAIMSFFLLYVLPDLSVLLFQCVTVLHDQYQLNLFTITQTPGVNYISFG